MKKLSPTQRTRLARQYNWAECIYDNQGNLVRRLAGETGDYGWYPVTVMQIAEVYDRTWKERG